MNEPAVMEVPKTFPMDVRHDYDGNPCSHRKAHNIYGTQMARATYHGVKDLLTEKAFYYYKICLCRRNATVPLGPEIMLLGSIYGLQTYKSKGCQFLEWDLLALISVDSQNNLQVIYMRGGFNWFFHPFCRTHSSGDHGDQEPWAFDEDIIDITRKFVNLRISCYHLYTMFWQYIEEGIPMLKPLVYYDQSDIQTHYRNDEFIFGNQI
jgi:alpha-glucosidase